MFNSVLVANRGEIACRIFRTAAKMGIRCIAVYSEVDADALHVQMADEAVCIGPAPAKESYLDMGKIINAAKQAGAQAIHPGYGFLSENARFAQACGDADITFVGPPVEAIELMGSKIASKQLMEHVGVPVLPGYHGVIQDGDFLASKAHDIGFPLLIKASAGGGGKGMRLVNEPAEFATQLAGAKRESKAAFGDDAVLLERYLIAPKHIEVQLMADSHGNVVHLFERDCSVQRRHQKVIEEAPASSVSPELRNELGQTAIMVAKRVNYVGAGTVEFIVQDEQFYFMEMNTRLQVEHPVTEAITGLDLVEMQLRVASGEPLGITQGDVSLHGHAIEARLYAENPGKKFFPSTGQLVHFEIAPTLRVDTGVTSGDMVSMHYDPMLAKLIAFGETRDSAIATLIDGLRASCVAGVEHNLGYLVGMLGSVEFRGGNYTTHIAEQLHADVVPKMKNYFAIAASAFLLIKTGSSKPRSDRGGFHNNLSDHTRVTLRQGKKEFVVDMQAQEAIVNDVVFEFIISSYADAEGGEVDLMINDRNLHAKVLKISDTIFVMADGHTEKFIDCTDEIER